MKIYKFVSLFVVLFFFQACEEGSKFTCEDRTTKAKRQCSLAEDSFIKEFNSITDTIEAFNPKDLENKYTTWRYPNDNSLPALHLLGEAHVDVEGILSNWGYINYISKNSQNKIKILLEGSDFVVNEKEDTLDILSAIYFHTYLVKIFVREKIKYTSASVLDTFMANNINQVYDLFFITYENLRFSNLIKSIHFNYWDHRGKSFKSRNISMAQRIVDHFKAKPQEPLVVIAGFEHFPLGEKIAVSVREPGLSLPNAYSDYYTFIEQIQRSRGQKRKLTVFEERFGATKIIYQTIIDNNFKARTLIPLSSVEFL